MDLQFGSVIMHYCHLLLRCHINLLDLACGVKLEHIFGYTSRLNWGLFMHAESSLPTFSYSSRVKNYVEYSYIRMSETPQSKSVSFLGLT